MKSIITFFKRILTKEAPNPVGRWNLENCTTKISQKVDLSNEDHCGPCGQYALTKTSGVIAARKDETLVKPSARTTT
jgi:hypothetical protein